MMPFPTWEEFIERLEEWQVEYVKEEAELPGMPKFTATYLRHTMDGTTFTCPISVDDPRQRVTPSMIRYVCKALNINSAMFGLHLG
jgi:hypothetical protein